MTGRRIAWLALFTVMLLVSGCSERSDAAELRDGDIIFHTSRSAQSQAIQQATGSRYSHMGLVFFDDGKPYVFEAIRTVQATPLDSWIARGSGGHYVVKRLHDADALLTTAAVAKIRRVAREFRGRPYDLVFAWSDDRIYCSELVWKIYDRALGLQIGKLQHLRDFDLDTPAVKLKLRERYGDRLPLDETVIAPEAMFRSPLLDTVVSR